MVVVNNRFQVPVAACSGPSGLLGLRAALLRHGIQSWNEVTALSRFGFPYWTIETGAPHLAIPYTLDQNDMKTVSPGGFATGQDWLDYVRDAFDVLYAEGATSPKMRSVGLHLRLIGRPGRAASLARTAVR